VGLNYHPKQDRIISAATDQTSKIFTLFIHTKVNIWSAKEGKLQKTLTGPVHTICSLASDECRILAGCHDGVLIEWNFDSLCKPQQSASSLSFYRLSNRAFSLFRVAFSFLSKPRNSVAVASILLVTTGLLMRYKK
jgi:WD40 repeat protein